MHGGGLPRLRSPAPASSIGNSSVDDSPDTRALRLENQVLRARIRELERSNQELLALVYPDRFKVGHDHPGDGYESQCSGMDSSVCSNCGRQIPSANFDAHVVHCERNFFWCVACGEVLPARDKDSHITHWTDMGRLLQAAVRLDFASLRTMRAHGANVQEATLDTGETLLHVAAAAGSLELATIALGPGMPSTWLLGALNAAGQAALHVAIASGREAVSAFLIESKADIEQRNQSGDTALILACRHGSTSLLRRLLDAAADVNVKNALGDTALQIAQSRGHVDCALLLGSHSLVNMRGVDSRVGSRGSLRPIGKLPPEEFEVCAG